MFIILVLLISCTSGYSASIKDPAFLPSLYGQTYAYVGCYKDSTPRDIPNGPFPYGPLQPSLCFGICSGFQYFGLQDGSQCFCGNSYGTYGTSTACTVACPGNSSAMCGGAYANSVYRIDGPSYPNGYAWGCVNISASLPFCNPDLSISQRVSDLVGRLTLDEKLGLMGGDTAHTGVDACTNMDAGILRLGIPNYLNLVETNTDIYSDCLQEGKCASDFGDSALMAATFNRTVYTTMGSTISTEMRAFNNLNWHRSGLPLAKIALTGFGPNINIVRDPRFGRNSELPSEDPFLTGTYAWYLVQGMQKGPDTKYLKMLSGLKHYALYSMEQNRGSFIPTVSTFDLFDTYLEQYRMGFSANMGNAAVTMCSYAGANGVPSCADDYLINQVVRSKWNRSDVVVGTDCGAIGNMISGNKYATNGPDAAAKSLKGGSDIDLGDGYFQTTANGGNGALEQAIQQGLTDEAHVNQAVSRILTKRFEAGLFDPLAGQQYNKLGFNDLNTTAAWQFTLEATLQGYVLLKNDNLLPLARGKKIALVGPHVYSQENLFEDYADGMCFLYGYQCVRTIAEYFQTSLGSNVTVVQGVDLDSTNTSQIPAALNAVGAADQVIMVLGISRQQEHETLDRTTTTLPGQQESFAEQVIAKAAGKPVILVIISGGIVSFDNLISGSTAIIQGFYPGARTAEALFKNIFGEVTTGWGRLPVTIYASNYVNQVTMSDFNMSKAPGRTYRYFTGKPLYEFGFGLSYNIYSLSASLNNNNTIVVLAKNTGRYDGDEVLMVYHRVSSAITSSVNHPVPIKALKDFKRVHVPVGTTANISFTVTQDYLSLTNADGNKVVYSGTHYLDVSDGVANTTVTIVVT